jgi:hypothetical protein
MDRHHTHVPNIANVAISRKSGSGTKKYCRTPKIRAIIEGFADETC